MMYQDFVFFIIFIVGLIFFSEIAIKKAVKISDYLGTSHFTIGFILVAVCTSLPELFVSVTSALAGQGGIAIGNVVGSNIADLGLVLGAAAMIAGIQLQRKEMLENAEVLFIITFIPLYFLIRDTIAMPFGILLLFAFVVYLVFLKKREGAVATHSAFDPETHKFKEVKFAIPKRDLVWALIVFVIAITGVILCAHYLIESSVNIMNALFLPPAFVGATILALGTSLPELVVAVKAVRQGYVSLAFGSVIGSCVVNLTLVLGAAAVIAPLTVSLEVFAPAIGFLMALNAMLWYVLTKYNSIPKKFGIVFVLVYVLFILSEIGVIVT
jgi:cation:H+ antiporter